MSSDSSNQGLYLYCIIPKNTEVELTESGMEKKKLYAIEFKDLMAIVSDSDYKVYDLSSENLFTHEGVIREIMGKTDVLPFNFGNVLKSQKDLIKFLDNTYEHMGKTFKKISGRLELGLKVLIKSEKFSDEVENTEIKQLKKLILNTDEKKAFSLKVELGKLVQKSLEQIQSKYEAKIFNYLKQYCSDAKTSNCSTVKMILNAAFLIDKDKQAIFDEEVNKIINQYEENFDFKYSGPWPPYNFVEIPD